VQDISLNPQKLAGQCSKLKCCLMYEYDVYADARQTMPRVREPLQAMDGEYYLVKTDILARTMSFSSSKETMSNVVTIPTSRVREIIAANRAGRKVESIALQGNEDVIEEPTFRTEEDSITRFDNQNRRRRNRNRRDKDSRHKDRDRQPKAVAEGEQAHEEGREEGRQRQERRRDRQRNNRQDAGSENRTQQQGDTPQNDTPKGEGQRRDRRRNNRSRNRGENQQEGRQEGKQDSRQDNREGGRNERRQEEHRTRQESRSEHKEPKQE
jgi:hypothetical protein